MTVADALLLDAVPFPGLAAWAWTFDPHSVPGWA
jgi:hypothetical protein